MIPLEDCIMDRPMYAIRQDRMLYVLLQAPFGEDESGVIAIKSGDGEKMHKLGGVIPVGGKVACHLALSPSGKYLYTANYISGSVSELPMLSSQITGSPSQVVRHSGSSIHPTRQTGPHCHCTVFTPDGKFLCVSDLGLDQILLYVLGGHGLMEKPFSVCSVDPGAGPRHVVFSPMESWLSVLMKLIPL